MPTLSARARGAETHGPGRFVRAPLFVAAATLALAHAAFAQAPSAAKAADGAAPSGTTTAAATPAANDDTLGEVVVTASRLNLLGIAATASQGSVTEKELELRPVYRVGQLLEATPGLVVTIHSGEGKANQYLLRGFNLDHGTDIANFIDDMPINRPTNTHGQGYSDLNFELPELADDLDYTKGPYYAAVGDFGAVASTHLKLANEIPNQMDVTLGTLGVGNVFLGGTQKLANGDNLTGGLYYGHVDGPFDPPENFNKYAGQLRYSHGTYNNGYSLTGMYFKDSGKLTTDQPVAALQEGLIGRYGTLDPSDANRSERWSLSGHYGAVGHNWKFLASAYYIHSTMTLWNDFTHYLDDPVNGDQEQQDEDRTTAGSQASLDWRHDLGSIQSNTIFGVQYRHDSAFVDRSHTRDRRILNYCSVENNGDYVPPAGSTSNADGSVYYIPARNGYCQADQVHLNDLSPYVENTTYWTSWLRTVLGMRFEYYQASDLYEGVTAVNIKDGTELSGSQTLWQPKASVVVGPFYQTELYFSGGRGFHSDDVRGVFGTVPREGEPGIAGATPLLAPATGYEVGLRTNLIPKVQIQLSVFREDFKSELRYDADQGQDAASAPSRRQGIEFSAQYRPVPWLEFNTDLAFSRARYQGSVAQLDGFGIDGGPYIANAPSFIGSVGILLDDGPWFAGLQWRALGAYPLTDGPQFPEDKGYSEFNANVGYRIDGHWTIEASGFNLLNTHANAAAYDYTYRLTPTSQAEDGPTYHSLEPLSGQVQVSYKF